MREDATSCAIVPAFNSQDRSGKFELAHEMELFVVRIDIYQIQTELNRESQLMEGSDWLGSQKSVETRTFCCLHNTSRTS